MAAPEGHIRIIAAPKGEIPEWVRAEWVGCQMPCKFKFEQEVGGASGCLPFSYWRYVVGQAEALRALAAKSPLAAAWWYEQGCPQQGLHFIFTSHEVEEILPVPEERLPPSCGTPLQEEPAP